MLAKCQWLATKAPVIFALPRKAQIVDRTRLAGCTYRNQGYWRT
jgi:hypothetical protein